MAVRASMEYIITFVRELINDPAGSTEKFTDEQIQARLDLKRLDVYGECLRAADKLHTDGTYLWTDFFAKKPFWETNVIIQKAGGALRTPDEADCLVGKFVYNVHQNDPLVISGRVYNVYAVAANLLTVWVGELRGQITSWTADGTTVQRTGQLKSMNDLASQYRSLAWGWGNQTQVKLVRKDLRN